MDLIFKKYLYWHFIVLLGRKGAANVCLLYYLEPKSLFHIFYKVTIFIEIVFAETASALEASIKQVLT